MFYVDHFLSPKAPATHEDAIGLLKKARHRHADSAQFRSRKLPFLVKAIGKHKFALAISLSLVALTPTRAEACSSEWIAVSRILGERTPGDSLARQAYEMRKSRAWADLNACQKHEREEKRQKVKEERQQQAYFQERQLLDQERTRAEEAPVPKLMPRRQTGRQMQIGWQQFPKLF